MVSDTDVHTLVYLTEYIIFIRFQLSVWPASELSKFILLILCICIYSPFINKS
jgi:hypothetical protein